MDKVVNRKDWEPTGNSGICAKHFDPALLKTGQRITLKWAHDPVPFVYSTSVDIPPFLLLTPSTSRKPPSSTTILPDQ